MEQPLNRLPPQENRDHGQSHRTRKPPQGSHFAGSKGKTGIMGMFAGKAISKCRNTQGNRMGTHVPTIGSQCHRTGIISRDQFNNHGYKSEDDDPMGRFFSRLEFIQSKGVVMM